MNKCDRNHKLIKSILRPSSTIVFLRFPFLLRQNRSLQLELTFSTLVPQNSTSNKDQVHKRQGHIEGIKEQYGD